MLDLRFTKIEAETIVFSNYIIKPFNNFMYIQPAENSTFQKTNPIKDIDTFIMDILDTAKTIISCKKYMRFLSKTTENSVIYEKNFWRYPDFFNNKAIPDVGIIESSMQIFVEKYGLPKWELESWIKAPLPPEYCVSSPTSTKNNNANDTDYLKKFLTDKMAREEDIVYPICSLTVFFIKLYNILTTKTTSKLKPIEHCRLYFRNEPDHEPELAALSVGLMPSIYLAFIAFTAGYHKAIHICKNCGNHFITTDARAEYCSSKCRSSYNTAQSRKRKKQLEKLHEQKFDNH